MIEQEEEAITDANSATDDKFSIAFNPQRENPNAIFASEKIENLNELVKAVARLENMTINNVRYEFIAATASDTKVEFASNLDVINHTKNIITDQNVLSSLIIRIQHKGFSILPPPMNPTVSAIVMAPQTLKSPAVQQIITEAYLNNTGKNRTPWKIVRTGVDGTTQFTL